MKLTVDSTEPLEDAMRVLGALYGVTLVVANEAQAASSKVQVPKKNRRGSGTRRNGASRPRRKAVAVAANGSASTPEIRSWARSTGLTVSDRGRISSSVMAAYRQAHTE